MILVGSGKKIKLLFSCCNYFTALKIVFSWKINGTTAYCFYGFIKTVNSFLSSENKFCFRNIPVNKKH